MKQYLLSLLILVCIDAILVTSVRGMYEDMIAEIQGSPMEARIIPALLAYPVMALGLWLLVVPRINKDNLIPDAILYGGSYGLALYGTYDFTLYCVFAGWWLKIVIAEVLGGMCVMTVASALIKTASVKLWGDDYSRANLKE